jgi:DNA polymerase-3 subunit alpha
VLESLIKAGAFDSLKSTRAGLLSGLDQAMEVGQRRQRDRDEGQASLFDALGGAPASVAVAPPAVPGVPEWPQEELLAFEKEVLGFYLSGHPLERYRDVARRLSALTSGELAARPVGARVLLLGMISAVTENATKSGNRMAFVTLELVDGTVPVTLFPEPYRSCVSALRHRGPVLVRGRTDDSDKGRVVLAEEIKPLDDATAGEPPQRLEVFLDIPILQRNERRRLPAEQWHPTPGSIGLLLGSDVAGGRRRPARLSTSRARAARRRLARSSVRRSASPRHRARAGSSRA